MVTKLTVIDFERVVPTLQAILESRVGIVVDFPV